ERMLVQKIRGHDVDAIQQVPDPVVGVVRRAADHAHHLVALGEQQLRQVRAVLSRDAGDQRRAPGLPRLGSRFRFVRPALTGGGMPLGAHLFSRENTWSECVKYVSWDTTSGTSSPNRTTRR